MTPGKQILRILTWFAVLLLQLIMTQIATLLLSFFIPAMENFPQTYPVLFVTFLGISFSLGVFLVGWLALRWGWLSTKPNYRLRLLATLVGAYVPLIIALLIYHTLEPGNPFFFVSMLTSVLGFHLAGWVKGK
jgi:hypothetical protein